ncbi:MAG: TolC family protein [Candidatus Omnitrophota bacterium]
MRNVICLLLAVSIFLPKFACAESKQADLDTLIAEALENNPQIQSAYNHWKAAEHKVKVVAGLPDPMASYTYFGGSIETRVGPQEHKYGLSQKIPFPGKLSLKAKAQNKRAGMLKEKYEAAKREIIKKIKFVYFDIFWVEKAIQITEEEKSILESLEKVAQRKYESNITPVQDVIKAQVELSKLIEKLFVLKQNRKSLAAKMSSILNRSGDDQLRITIDIEPTKFAYDLNELSKMARNLQQDLLAANLEVQRAEYEKSIAKMDYLPDFTLGFDYIEIGSGYTTASNDGDDAWMSTIKVSVPIWFDRLGAQLKEKRSTLEATRKSYESLDNSIIYEIEDMYFKVLTYKDIISLYETALVPQTELAFEAARTGYETGKVDFLNWLDAERVLLQTRLAHYKSIADYEKSIAYLERVVGRDL